MIRVHKGECARRPEKSNRIAFYKYFVGVSVCLVWQVSVVATFTCVKLSAVNRREKEKINILFCTHSSLAFYHGWPRRAPRITQSLQILPQPLLQFASCTISFVGEKRKNAVIICFMALGVFFAVALRYSELALDLFVLLLPRQCVHGTLFSMPWASDAWRVVSSLDFFFFLAVFLRFVSNKTSGSRVRKENLYVKRTSVCHCCSCARQSTRNAYGMFAGVSSAFDAILASNPHFIWNKLQSSFSSILSFSLNLPTSTRL